MRYVEGDITNAPERFIVHGCNMRGKMNSGVAKALRNKYPHIFDDYQRGLNSGLILGCFKASYTIDGKIIGNLLTQEYYGYDGGVYASLPAIQTALELFIDYELVDCQSLFGPTPIATPKLGCGRGGLQWDEVRPVLEMLESMYDVEFVIYDVPDEYST